MTAINLMERFFAKRFSKNRFLSILELGRPWNGLAPSLTVLIGILISSSILPSINTTALAMISVLFCFSAGTVLNDVFDIEIDKLNMNFRPLQSKRVTYREAVGFMLLLYILGLGISLFLTFKFFVSIIIFTISSILYSLPPFSIEKRGFLAQIWLSIATFLIPAYAGIVLITDNFYVPNELLLSFVSFTLMYSFIVIIKDFKDVRGDMKGGKRTFVLSVGEKTSKGIMITGTLIMFIITMYFLNLTINNFLFLIFSLPFIFTTLYNEIRLKNPEIAFQNIRLSAFYFLLIIILFSVLRI